MPIYQYKSSSSGCAVCREGIEVLQRLSDPPLTACPECGAELTRVISAPQVISGQSHVLREGHIAEHGFTQYRRVAKGKYEKTAGHGPATIGDE